MAFQSNLTNYPLVKFRIPSTLFSGKTLLARAVASQLDANFLKVVSSAIVDKYIGESARLIREMFNYARDHQVCSLTFSIFEAL